MEVWVCYNTDDLRRRIQSSRSSILEAWGERVPLQWTLAAAQLSLVLVACHNKPYNIDQITYSAKHGTASYHTTMHNGRPRRNCGAWANNGSKTAMYCINCCGRWSWVPCLRQDDATSDAMAWSLPFASTVHGSGVSRWTSCLSTRGEEGIHAASGDRSRVHGDTRSWIRTMPAMAHEVVVHTINVYSMYHIHCCCAGNSNPIRFALRLHWCYSRDYRYSNRGFSRASDFNSVPEKFDPGERDIQSTIETSLACQSLQEQIDLEQIGIEQIDM